MESKRKFMGSRKGLLGLDTVKSVMLMLLVLGVLAIAIFTTFPNLTSTNVIPAKTITDQHAINETINPFSDLGNATISVRNLTGVTINNIIAINGTGALVPCTGSAGNYSSAQCIIGAGNYSVTGGTFTPVLGGNFNNTIINVSYDFNYKVDSDAIHLANNITSGTTSFFSNVPTIFSILGAVVIITAIVLIIIAVNRFSSASGFSGQ